MKTKTSLYRRGQAEMIGLVLIVAIIIVGIVLYLAFSNRGTSTKADTANRLQGHSSFLLAFLDTKVPTCGISVQEVAAACAENDGSVCNGRPPCGELQSTMNAIAGPTLKTYGEKYNLRLSTGTDTDWRVPASTSSDNCKTNDLSKLLTYPSAAEPVPTNGIQAVMLLTICR